MNKYVVEFIGTFFLVLTIGCTVINGGSGVIPPLAIGSALIGIALNCGFSSETYMNDVFRKRLGITPQEFRRNI